MGVLNVTPDSFSDGGESFEFESAIRTAARLIEEGADIIDIGGESTRPGSESVSPDEELRRVIPVIEELVKRFTIPLSIDTCKSAVARRALEAGASIVNDISAGTFDPEMASVVSEFKAGVVLMHIKGTPRDMQKDPQYSDVVSEVRTYLKDAAQNFERAGVSRDRILVDPGIGFGKKLEHNLDLIGRLSEFQGIGAGVMYGPSRKSFIGMLTGKEVKQRLEGTIAAVVAGALHGADIVRVHDVAQIVDALKVADAFKLNVAVTQE